MAPPEEPDRRSLSRHEAIVVALALLLSGTAFIAWGESIGWLLVLAVIFVALTQVQALDVPSLTAVHAVTLPEQSHWDAPMPRPPALPDTRPPMLVEVAQARQIPNESKRRWFSSADMDLIVWLDADDIAVGFQLCYDKPMQEKAFEWRRDRGYRHMNVDDGEDRPRHYKRSPILVPDGHFDARRVAGIFDNQSMQLPRHIFELVSTQINAHPDFGTASL